MFEVLDKVSIPLFRRRCIHDSEVGSLMTVMFEELNMCEYWVGFIYSFMFYLPHHRRLPLVLLHVCPYRPLLLESRRTFHLELPQGC